MLLAALVLFCRVTLTRHGQGWRRVRSIRFRLWLWLRPGKGFASLPELWLRWGRMAAVSYGARSRPGLGLLARLTLPATEYAVRLGRAQYGRRLYAAFELHVLILAPPRTDKTGLLADRIIRHPGPVLTTSTRADLHQLTSNVRRFGGRGPVHVFNPEQRRRRSQHLHLGPARRVHRRADGLQDGRLAGREHGRLRRPGLV